MGIPRHDLAETTKRLTEANSAQIELDDALFQNLTVDDATSCQMLYLIPKVTCLFLSQKACKELHAMHPDSPEQVIRVDQHHRTAMDNDNRNWDCPNNTEKHKHT